MFRSVSTRLRPLLAGLAPAAGRRVAALALAAVIVPGAALAQAPAGICAPILASGVYDTNNVMSTASLVKRLKDAVCSDQMQTYSQAEAAGGQLGVNVIDIVDVSLGGHSESSNYTARRDQFCKLRTVDLNANSYLSVQVRSANVALAQVYAQCVQHSDGLVAYVTPSSDLKRFVLTVQKRAGIARITSFTVAPQASCSKSLEQASAAHPSVVVGSDQFVCTRQDATDSVVLVGSTRDDGALFHDRIELPGVAESVGGLADRLAAIEGAASPSGMVGYFDARTCPAGWADLPRDWEGRYVVTTVADASPGVRVGTALADGENRPTGAHQHTTGVAFYGGNCDGGPNNPCGGWSGKGGIARAPMVTQTTTGLGGGPAMKTGTNAPYVTLRGCVKR